MEAYQAAGELPPKGILTLHAVADLLQSIAWPLAAVIVAIIFARDIRDMASRIVRFGKDGLVLVHRQVGSPATQDFSSEELEETVLEELRNPVAREIELANKEAAAKLPDQSRQEHLIRALTTLQLHKAFAKAYANIFGSQIRALRELNSRPVSRQQAETWFAELRDLDPALKDWTLDAYMQFLLNWKLVEMQGGDYHITLVGVDFLQFLVAEGLSEDRPH